MGISIFMSPQPSATVKSPGHCLNSVAGMYLCCWQGLCQRAGDVLGMRIGSFCDLTGYGMPMTQGWWLVRIRCMLVALIEYIGKNETTI